MRDPKLSLLLLALAGLSGVTLLHRNQDSDLKEEAVRRPAMAAAVGAGRSEPAAEVATLIAVEPGRWESLARAAKVFPTVCFNLTNDRSGFAHVDSVIDVRESARGADGRWQRHWLVRTDMHHPLVRIEDTVQSVAGGAEQVVHRVSMVADHVIATFPGGVTPAALAGTGLELRDRLLGTDFYLVSFPAPDAEALPLVLGALRAGGGLVASADADFVNYTMDLELPGDNVVVTYPTADPMASDPIAVAMGAGQAQGIPNDAGFGSLWGMRNTGATSGYVSGMDINAANAWNVRTDASSVVVGVIDTGIRTTHQDLAANIWTNAGETGLDSQGRNKATNGVDDDGNGYIDDVYGINSITNSGLNSATTNDDHGHGTHVSGTIGGNGNNGVGVAGVCWKVQLMALKFLNSQGSGYDSDAIKCLAYARAKGAKVTSNSWGGGGYSGATLTAIQQARDADILFIAAAGNSGANNDVQANYPCGYNVENVVSVASMQGDGTRSSFSCYGATTVDVAAPGSSIYSCSFASDASYTTMSGTSMATPHVSGIVALMRAQLPTMTYAEIVSRLFAKTDTMAAWSGVVARGGRVDAYRAIAEVMPQLAQNASVASAKRGGSVTIAVSASDPLSGSLTYQWRRIGVAVAGANASSLTISNLQPSNLGSYDCLVTNATGTVASSTINVVLRGGADFDGNGTPDILWTQASTGRRVIWTMNGTARISSTSAVELGTIPSDWVMNGVADFDGNGTPDILWTQVSTGRRVIWTMNGTARTSSTSAVELGTIPSDWVINGAADFDGNGSPDILWTQASTGRRVLWTMNGTARLSNYAVELGTIPTDWVINGAADFDGNGSPDILWTQVSTGRRVLWTMNGTARTSNTAVVELGTIPPEWTIDGTGDFDGNGSPDILWTQASTGRRVLWLMNGTARMSNTAVELGTIPTDWRICNR